MLSLVSPSLLLIIILPFYFFLNIPYANLLLDVDLLDLHLIPPSCKIMRIVCVLRRICIGFSVSLNTIFGRLRQSTAKIYER